MLVIKPLIIASIIINKVYNTNELNWKNNIVLKFPMLQPTKHHRVLYALFFKK